MQPTFTDALSGSLKNDVKKLLTAPHIVAVIENGL